MSNVELTSEAVRSVKFREKLKGYHPEDVDSFLERAASALEQLSERLTEATARALKAEAALARNNEGDDAVRRTLVLAQRTAELAVREANEEAARLRSEAGGAAERVRAEAEAAAEKALSAARERAAELEAEAEKIRAAAVEHATATVDEADAQAVALIEVAERRTAVMRAEAENEIAARRLDAAAEVERLCEEAHREITASVLSLQEQRDQLWGDVAKLSQYLADERARVLDLLAGSVDRFGESLTPAPVPPLQTEPADLMPALAAADELIAEAQPVEVPSLDEPADASGGEDAAVDAVEDEATDDEAGDDDGDDAEWESIAAEAEDEPDDLEEPDEVEELEAPDDEVAAEEEDEVVADAEAPQQAAAEEPPEAVTHDEEPPAALLFTLEDDLRRPDPTDRFEVPVDPRGRKPLIGRRRG